MGASKMPLHSRVKTMHGSRLLHRITAACLVPLFFGLVGLAAQGTQKPTTAPDASRVPDDDDPRKVVGESIDPRTYVVGPEDILRVMVWGEPQLSGPVLVRPDGFVTLPLLEQDVKAGGETPRRLAEQITSLYEKIITRPVVSVTVATVNSKKYFIIGQVEKPGQYPLVVPTTVMQALAIAGGLKEFADAKNIIVLRGPKQHKFNYKDVIRGKNRQQDIYLESGDMVSVP